MKLMSQLSAAMASTIIIPKQGMKSARNLFAKKNFSLVQAVEGQALIFLENLQFTNGNAAFGRVGMAREGDNKLSLFMYDDVTGVADRVIYNLYARNEEGDIMLINSVVATDRVRKMIMS